jgi:hypothetical protein
LYVELHAPRVFVTPVLADGQAVSPEPKSAGSGRVFWEWNAPEAVAWVRIVGLGVGYREYCTLPDMMLSYSTYGYLNQITNCLFGFRVSKPDGWHLGWLRLLTYDSWGPDNKYSSVHLTEYDVHPEPNTEIRAGQYAQPRLRVVSAGGKVTVSWPTAWTGCALERTRNVGQPAWAPAPGVTNNSAMFETGDAPWYFRLKR